MSGRFSLLGDKLGHVREIFIIRGISFGHVREFLFILTKKLPDMTDFFKNFMNRGTGHDHGDYVKLYISGRYYLREK